MKDNFMEEFSDFVAPPFTHCTYERCELAINCIHSTFKKIEGDLYANLNVTSSNGFCNNFSENLTIKYKYSR